MTIANIKKRSVLFAAAILTAACSQVAPEGGSQSSSDSNDEVVRLAPGEVKNYTFEADEQMMISWRHEGDKDTALACQGEREDPDAPLPQCAGIFQSNGSRIVSSGPSAKGLHGAGVGFKPTNGKINVALKNISQIPLDLSVEARPAI